MNSFAPVPHDLLDVKLPAHDGYPADLAAGDSPSALRDACGDTTREFSSKYWIEPKDRPAKAAENDKYHTWGRNYLDRFTNQQPTTECTCHMLRAMLEACRNRQRGIIFPNGPVRDFRYEQSANGSVWLAPMSVYPEADPSGRRGAGCRQVLEIAVRRGMLPEKIQPRDYKFKHAMHGTCGKGGKNQSTGTWVPMSQFPAGYEETSKWFKPLEIVITYDEDEAICLLHHGAVGGVGRDGHAIPYDIWHTTQNAAGYSDSYDVFRADSRATFRRAVAGGFMAVMSMVAPDDWLNPAGAIAV